MNKTKNVLAAILMVGPATALCEQDTTPFYSEIRIEEGEVSVEFVGIDVAARQLFSGDAGVLYDCPSEHPCVNAGGIFFAPPDNCNALHEESSWTLQEHTFHVLSDFNAPSRELYAIEIRNAGKREAIAYFSPKRGLVSHVEIDANGVIQQQFQLVSDRGVFAGACAD